jgi:acetyl-CoA carboxylase carboxyl transferase subunit alpha
MGVTADRLLELGLIDEIVPEPLGSAHRDPEAMAQTLQNALAAHLRELESLDVSEMLSQRAARLEALGVFKET